MVVSLRFIRKFQKKSISLPCRSHASTHRIEEELTEIKETSSTKPSADNIAGDLSQLVQLYKCIDDLLDSFSTQNLISSQKNETWVEDVMEGSIKFLDICSILRDAVFQMQQHVQDLCSALRRRKGHTSIEISIKEYNCFRKKMMKHAKELKLTLKQSEKVMELVVDPSNHRLTALIRVFMEVTEIVVDIFESLLMFIASPVSKENGRSLVLSKLIRKRTLAFQDDEKQEETMNELETIDVQLHNILCNARGESLETTQVTLFKLEELQGKMMKIESGLDCMFRRFLKSRTSLLNIISL